MEGECETGGHRDGISKALDGRADSSRDIHRSDLDVAYLLNIGILGPVAPLTGQCSSGGLN